jgi:hypothetical protein
MKDVTESRRLLKAGTLWAGDTLSRAELPNEAALSAFIKKLRQVP